MFLRGNTQSKLQNYQDYPMTNHTTLIIATIKNRFKEVEVLITIERRSRYITLPCDRHVAMAAQFLVDNKLKTSLQKWICTVSNFTDLIQFHLICQMLAKCSGVEYKGPYLGLEKEIETFVLCSPTP